MSPSPPVPQTKHFTPFRSAAEEAATKSAEDDREAPGERRGSKYPSAR